MSAVIQARASEPRIHELLRQRRSPYAIDPVRSVPEGDVLALFEAARWMMSSYNAQPWRYIVGVRNRSPKTWQKVLDVLAEGNRPWARNAPVLALGVVEHTFEHDGSRNKAATHDLGAASAGLTVEASARGLVVHQMIGLDPDRAREVFHLAPSQEVLTALAIGYRGSAEEIPEAYADRDAQPRVRKPLDEIIIGGSL